MVAWSMDKLLRSKFKSPAIRNDPYIITPPSSNNVAATSDDTTTIMDNGDYTTTVDNGDGMATTNNEDGTTTTTVNGDGTTTTTDDGEPGDVGGTTTTTNDGEPGDVGGTTTTTDDGEPSDVGGTTTTTDDGEAGDVGVTTTTTDDGEPGDVGVTTTTTGDLFKEGTLSFLLDLDPLEDDTEPLFSSEEESLSLMEPMNDESPQALFDIAVVARQLSKRIGLISLSLLYQNTRHHNRSTHLGIPFGTTKHAMHLMPLLLFPAPPASFTDQC